MERKDGLSHKHERPFKMVCFANEFKMILTVPPVMPGGPQSISLFLMVLTSFFLAVAISSKNLHQLGKLNFGAFLKLIWLKGFIFCQRVLLEMVCRVECCYLCVKLIWFSLCLTPIKWRNFKSLCQFITVKVHCKFGKFG